MNIVMFTNTFTPHVGGVARSVSGLADGLRRRGHRVLVVAPKFPEAPAKEMDVIRVPAVQRFGGSDFSMPLPLGRRLSDDLDAFGPDIVHSHHPFLLGDTALRAAAARDVPTVFTYHTRYELYDHYVAPDSDRLRRLVLSLSLGYCDLCSAVIAPSQSIADHLRKHGVEAPIHVIPSGIDVARFAAGDRARARRALGLSEEAFVVGHVGRLAPEKNLDYLARALAGFLKAETGAVALVTGDGASRSGMASTFEAAGLSGRIRFTGVLVGEALIDAYAAMDVFAFSSHSETQGLVLAEAMAAEVPVVALDAPGVREVVRDGVNGRLLTADASSEAFASALGELARRDPPALARMRGEARRTAETFSSDRSLDRTLQLYDDVAGKGGPGHAPADGAWQSARRSLEREIDIIGNFAHAVGDAVLIPPSEGEASPAPA